MAVQAVIEKVAEFLATSCEPEELNGRAVVAVSGGQDSFALLHSLIQLGWSDRILVGHLDHGLRGDQSAEDGRIIKEWCDRQGIRHHVARRDVAAQSHGKSMQHAARDVRRQFLKELVVQFDAKLLMLGHTRDDRAETVLLNASRGTGLRGLGAMPPRDGIICRPLCNVARSETLAYCVEADIPVRVDPTNETTKYSRNVIRNMILPAFVSGVHPATIINLNRLAEHAESLMDWIEDLTKEWLKTHAVWTPRGLSLEVAALTREHYAFQSEIMRQALSQSTGSLVDVDNKVCESLVKLCKQENGSVNLPGGFWRARRVSSVLSIERISTPLKSQTPTIQLPSAGEVVFGDPQRIVAVNEHNPPFRFDSFRSDDALWVDADRIVSPLILRQRMPGDRLHPMGAPGQRKLQDILVDRKIPRDARDTLLIVEDAEGIIGVVGVVVAARASLTETTSRALRIGPRPTRENSVWSSSAETMSGQNT